MSCDIHTRKKRDVYRAFGINTPLRCEDCGDEMQPKQRRRKCSKCGKLVCGWCFNHVHGLDLSAGGAGER